MRGFDSHTLRHFIYTFPFVLLSAIILLMADTPLTRVTDYLGFTNVRSKEPVPPTEGPSFLTDNYGEKKILHEWTIVSHPTQVMNIPKLNRSYTVIGIFIAFLLILMQEFILIAAVGSAVFLWYVLSAAAPEEVTHRITTHGVEFAGDFYPWPDLKQFFFTRTGNMPTLCIDTTNSLPGRLIFMINAGDQTKLREVIGKYIQYLEEPPQNVTDKFFKSAADRINLTPQE